MKLTTAEHSFILHWGDMGVNWGISRSTCQIQALLYLQQKPLNAEDISETLKLARSNVSTSLKELLQWNLISRVPIVHDRRDHFTAETDVWEIARRITLRRKQQEIDPALSALRKCVALAAEEHSPEVSRRLGNMLHFTERLDAWTGDMQRLPRGQLEMLLKLGAKIASFLPRGK